MLDYASQSPAPSPPSLVPARREQQVIEAFAAVAGSLAGGSGLTTYLSDLAGHCSVLAGADAAVATLAAGDGEEPVTACWPAGSSVADLFSRPGTPGPHAEAAREAVQIAQPDLATPDPRWLKFAALAMNAGYRSVYALPLGLPGETMGALSLLRVLPGRIAAPDLCLCGALAGVAAASLLQQRILAGHRLAAAARAGQDRLPTLTG